MNIGIFGDSWASLNLGSSYLGWPELLGKKYKVNNFAVPGSSLYFSYKKFLKHHTEHDVNVFLITSPNRLELPQASKLHNQSLHYISGPNSVNMWRNKIPKNHQNLSELDKIGNAIELYYRYIQDDERDLCIANSLLYHLRSLTSNTIFIPCFNDYGTNSLIDVFFQENLKLGVIEKYFKRNLHFGYVQDGKVLEDMRVCHLTKENNDTLAQLIENAIKTGDLNIKLSMDQFDFSLINSNNLDNYVRWISIG